MLTGLTAVAELLRARIILHLNTSIDHSLKQFIQNDMENIFKRMMTSDSFVAIPFPEPDCLNNCNFVPQLNYFEFDSNQINPVIVEGNLILKFSLLFNFGPIGQKRKQDLLIMTFNFANCHYDSNSLQDPLTYSSFTVDYELKYTYSGWINDDLTQKVKAFLEGNKGSFEQIIKKKFKDTFNAYVDRESPKTSLQFLN